MYLRINVEKYVSDRVKRTEDMLVLKYHSILSIKYSSNRRPISKSLNKIIKLEVNFIHSSLILFT